MAVWRNFLTSLTLSGALCASSRIDGQDLLPSPLAGEGVAREKSLYRKDGAAEAPPIRPSATFPREGGREHAYLALMIDALSTDSRPIPSHLRAADGFSVEVAASAPLVQHPLMAGFDDRGRLYVAESAGRNMNEAELLRETPNYIRRLEDTDSDGRFDRSTIFADKMTFPMGALWHRGALYVASPPNIWRFEDADDDGVAERREAIVGKFGFVGNAADVHGCFLGPTGRIFWCDGRHGHEFSDDEGRVYSRGQAARIFSCRPDGSGIEVFCGGGMDNPVEVAFGPNGDVFGTMTFYNPDDARHDALVHYQYGGVYPRKHPVVAEFKRTGDFLPPLRLYDTVAPSGLAHYDGPFWGPEFEGNLLSVHFNTHQVLRHVLTPEGASHAARDEILLQSSDVDFHPTDVLVDADGSVLVLDTGGWFLHGCPTSQVAKPEVLGSIYRVRRRDAVRPDDPRGMHLDDWSAAPPDALAARLSDSRPAVRERTVEALAALGNSSVDALAKRLSDVRTSVVARQHAVWALARIESPQACDALCRGLADLDSGVRKAAAHAVGVLRISKAGPRLLELLGDESLPVQREAAAALGRLRNEPAVPALLDRLAQPGIDRFVEHALIYALIEIAVPRATAEGLAHSQPQPRRGALIALDQMDGGLLTREQVLSCLDTADSQLEQAALEIVRRRGWTTQLLSTFDGWLAVAEIPVERRAMFTASVGALAEDDQVETWIGANLHEDRLSPEGRVLLLQAAAQAQLPELPGTWRAAAGTALASESEAERLAALRLLHGQVDEETASRCGRLVADEKQPRDVRIAAARALAASARPLRSDALNVLREELESAPDALARQAIAGDLSTAALTESQVVQLLPLLANAGPLELVALLPLARQARSDDVARSIVAAVAQASGSASLSSRNVEELVSSLPEGVRDEARRKFTALTPPVATDAARLLAELQQGLPPGDPAHGRAVFGGTKAACAACHQVAGAGGRIGPDLSHVAAIRARRDLLESIALPSASLARGYESVVVTTQSGHVHLGRVSRETPEALWLTGGDRGEQRLARGDIESIEPGSQSIMPQGYDRVLSNGELSDLISYLETLK